VFKTDRRFAHSAECVVGVAASPQTLFDYLDDPRRLGSHMEKASWRTGWSRMNYDLDARAGREVGSEIWMTGRVPGLPLDVEEVVIERTPPASKVWETRGTPHLFVIGPYRMGYQITEGIEASAGQSRLRLFIDFEPFP
jgi:hypothetical protein